MVWLAAHIWFLLFIAFGIGLGTGWWIWGARSEQPSQPQNSDTPMGTLDIDYDPAEEQRKT
ncbi:hypothetical protein PUV54_14180 [Hyphococcus flavus]|uniref:Uncharacterized protein n=1 Tax=Hyphococcus flavus TaxID=1866326 RepID=A0AAE9ZCR4_9PROT|nr:hypothetical protein [Hyphococcus flavus]WDI31100.1 hypothetical protein PUV54_14180 [Hyphococcus flavus]